MGKAGDALIKAADGFLQSKLDSIKASTASRQATIAQDLVIESNKRLLEEFQNTKDGEFNAEAQLEWYDSRVNELTSKIDNKNQRTKFEDLLKKNRGSFAIEAERLAFKDSIALEQASAKKRGANFSIALTDPNTNPDQLLLSTLEANKYAREEATRTGRAIYDTEDETFVIKSVTEKANRLKRDFSLRKISRADYEVGIDSLGNLLREPGVLDHLEGNKITGLFTAIDELKTTSKLEAEENYLNNLASDYTGEVSKIEQGFEPNQEYISAVNEAYKKHPENQDLKKMKNQLEVLSNHGNTFTSIRIGDVKSAQKQIESLRESLPNLDGQKVVSTSLAIAALESKVQAQEKLRIENTAEAFKNNPDVKSAWASVLLDNSPEARVNYVNTLVRLDKAQGGNGKNIEFFNKKMIQNYVANLDGMSPDQMEAQILSLKDEWPQSTGIGSTVADSIINQISAAGKSTNIAARYAGTPFFNKIYQAQNRTKAELKTVEGRKTDMKQLRDDVQSEVSKYIDVLIKRNPDNQEAVAREIDAIYKTALGAPLDEDSGVSIGFSGDTQKAARWAVDLHINSVMELKNKGRVNMAIPRDPTKNRKAKEILKIPTSILGDIMMKEAAKRAGVDVTLRGDEDSLINEMNIPGLNSETFDYRSLKDDWDIVNSQDGEGFAISLPVKVGKVPASFTDKNGSRVAVEFSIDDLHQVVKEREIREKQEKEAKVVKDFANLKRGSIFERLDKRKDKEIDKTVEKSRKQRAKTDSKLEKQLQKMEEQDRKNQALLKEIRGE